MRGAYAAYVWKSVDDGDTWADETGSYKRCGTIVLRYAESNHTIEVEMVHACMANPVATCCSCNPLPAHM